MYGAQDCVLTLGQEPALQLAASVSVEPVQLSERQEAVVKPHAVADVPLQVPWQVPLPAQTVRAPCGWPDVTVVQTPGVAATSHAWHCPVQLVSQHLVSTQLPVVH